MQLFPQAFPVVQMRQHVRGAMVAVRGATVGVAVSARVGATVDPRVGVSVAGAAVGAAGAVLGGVSVAIWVGPASRAGPSGGAAHADVPSATATMSTE